jgi:hypothetical protein
LRLRQGSVATRQHDETLAELVDDAAAAQHGKLADGAIRQWWAEVRIDKLQKLLPRGTATIEFHAVEPKLGAVEQVERRERHPLVVRCPTHMEEPLAGAVEIGKFHLVVRGVRVVAEVPSVVIPSATRCALRHLDPLDGILQLLLMLFLVGHHRF